MAQGMRDTRVKNMSSSGAMRLAALQPGENREYVMYHGTTRENADTIQSTGFRQSADGMLGRGVYLSRDLEKASQYPDGHPEHNKVIIKVVVNVGKVIAINYLGHPRMKTWYDRRYGPVYDTAWVPPTWGMGGSGLEEACVWDPNRIRIIQVITPPPVQPTSFGYGGYGHM